MIRAMTETEQKRIALDEFLAGLPQERAEKAREAARRMLDNERTSARLRGIEAELKPFFIAAVVSFVIGLVILLFFSQPGGFLDRVSGGWPLLAAALGFLPAVLAYYAFRIRGRSAVDQENYELNKTHFLPNGAIYFPSDRAGETQMVTLVEVDETAGARSKYDKLKPGAIW